MALAWGKGLGPSKWTGGAADRAAALCTQGSLPTQEPSIARFPHENAK